MDLQWFVNSNFAYMDHRDNVLMPPFRVFLGGGGILQRHSDLEILLQILSLFHLHELWGRVLMKPN